MTSKIQEIIYRAVFGKVKYIAFRKRNPTKNLIKYPLGFLVIAVTTTHFIIFVLKCENEDRNSFFLSTKSFIAIFHIFLRIS